MTKRYPIRVQRGILIFLALFFAVAAGLLIREASALFYAFAAIPIAFVAASVYVLVHARPDLEVVLDDEAITAPISLFRDRGTRRLPYAEITSIREISTDHHLYLAIEAPAGKLQFERDCLPQGAFEEIAAELRSRVPRS